MSLLEPCFAGNQSGIMSGVFECVCDEKTSRGVFLLISCTFLSTVVCLLEFLQSMNV